MEPQKIWRFKEIYGPVLHIGAESVLTLFMVTTAETNALEDIVKTAFKMTGLSLSEETEINSCVSSA